MTKLAGVDLDLLNGLVIDLTRPKNKRAKRANDSELRPVDGSAKKGERSELKAKPAPKAVDPLDGYVPTRRVKYVGRQRCGECGGRTEYVAGDLLEYRSVAKMSGVRTIRTRAFAKTDYRWGGLEVGVEYLEEEETTCPECLRLSRVLDSGLDILLGLHPREPVQVPLF